MKLIEKLPDKSYRLVCFGIIAGVCLAFLGSIFLDWVVIWGEKIPQTDIGTDYFWGALWALMLGATIIIWPVPWEDKGHLVFAWFIKALIALSVVLLYEYKYEIDSVGYYFKPMSDDFIDRGFSLDMTEAKHGARRGSWNITTLAVYQNFILSDSYHALKISFCLAGLVGGYLFYCASKVFLGFADRRLFYAFIFFPSIFFWTSLPGKESIALAFTGLYCYGVISWHKFGKFKYFLMLLAGGILTMYVRVWSGLILFIPLLVIILNIKRNSIIKWMVFPLVIFMIGFTAYKFSNITGIYSTQDLIEKIEFNIEHGRGGSAIKGGGQKLGDLKSVAFELVKNFPKILFRPFPGDVPSAVGLLAGLEGVVLLLMFFRVVYRTRLGELKEPLVLWAMGVVLIWASIYALSAFNLGTIVRWRVQILPIFLGLLLYLGRRRQRVAEVSSPGFPVTAGQNSGL
ncbi:MAG: hypothetical protein HN472_07045 [Nitrospina sp.]|jgi:hypothetical protein|nr:hypothetical protein [Nitrospina sp.]MBT3677103.1 hypothetical protein [Candidatus Neomarinimicrobiota bacterium]MBT4047291.1 hypothetical protein [Nitrospina sp.]MBT4556806.1 hypothetical protein [Nitrospina sp.]MBT6739160.1 hypothetical protein [Nitrospina sp.]